MKPNTPFIFAFLFIVSFLRAESGLAAEQAKPDLTANSANWILSGDAEFVEAQGRKSLKMGYGKAMLDGVSFATGVISFDLFVTGGRGFPGLVFRVKDADNYESFYVRPHQSGNPDASQYTPVFNRVAAWQLYFGKGFSSAHDLPVGKWFNIRVDLYRDSALISLDGKKLLHIDDLIMDHEAGALGLASTFETALFSNFTAKPIADYVDPIEVKQKGQASDKAVATWQVSQALSPNDATQRAQSNNLSGVKWSAVKIDHNGFANLARVAKIKAATTSALARFQVTAKQAEDVIMAFGFSDKVEIYLNGRLLYKGQDNFASRDYRFLGSIGFYDQVRLPLKVGMNDIIFVVTENFGGWGAGAKLIFGQASSAGLVTIP